MTHVVEDRRRRIAGALERDMFSGREASVHRAGERVGRDVRGAVPAVRNQPENRVQVGGALRAGGTERTVRRLGTTGQRQFGGASTFVSTLIASEPVGLLPIADDIWELYYGPVLLAQVPLKNKELQFSKRR